MKQQDILIPQWSATIGEVPPTGRTLAIEATPAERRAIADAYGVRDIESFKAQIELQPYGRDGVRLSGGLAVDLTQSCVVSLRPVEARIEAKFERRYLPAEHIAALRAEAPGARKARAELIVDLEDEEPPEPLAGKTIDVATVLLEEFALALDPYPRHPDAVLKGATQAGDARQEDGPFAVLRGRRGGKTD